MNDIQPAINRLYDARLLWDMLRDHTTGDSITGEDGEPLKINDIVGEQPIHPIIPRWQKAKETQAARTRKRAEVFTPTWLADKMISMIESENQELKNWREYIGSTFLEVTCGEGAFIVTRYDPANGNPIPLNERKGILDRKLRLIRDHAGELTYYVNCVIPNGREWYERTLARWSMGALQSTYGYELQGDSLLIARVNALLTWADHIRAMFDREPTLIETQDAIICISRNLWQMDGLTDLVPGRQVEAVIMDWNTGEWLTFHSLKGLDAEKPKQPKRQRRKNP